MALVIAWRFSAMAKSVTGSLRNGVSSAGARALTGDRPPCPAHHGSNLLGIAQQVLDLRVLGETRFQERLVGRVLQQPAHQVSHAWQHGSIGRVNPDPVAAGDQCGLNHVAHAVQCLELEAGGAISAVSAAAIAWARLRMLWLPKAGRSFS